MFITAASPFAELVCPFISHLSTTMKGLLRVWALNWLWNILPSVCLSACIILAQVCKAAATWPTPPSPSSLCPYPCTSQEACLSIRNVITYFIKRLLLSGDGQWAQLNYSWDVCGYYGLIPDNMSHLPWSVSSNMHFFLSHHLQISDLTYFPFLYFFCGF